MSDKLLGNLSDEMEEPSSEFMSSVEGEPAVPIEELALDVRLKLAQKFNFFKYAKTGDFLDAQDTISMWCMATIEEMTDETKILVHYDGWSSKWDQRFHTFQTGVAPFRKYTRGYTGQQKYALRNNMSLEADKLAELSTQLRNIIEKDFECFENAFEITQILRGRLYVWLDFLMSHDYKANSNEVQLAHDFFKLFLEIIVAWLKKIPTLLKAMEQFKAHSELYLVDRKVALCACMGDFIDLLQKVFCQDPRTLRYYECFDMAAENEGKETAFTVAFDNETVKNVDSNRIEMPYLEATIKRANKTRGHKITYGKLHSYFNLFCEKGGLDAIVGIINASEIGSNAPQLPVDFIVDLTSAFRKLGDVIHPQCAEKFVLAVKDTIFKRLDSIGDRDLKELDKDLIARTLRNMKEFLMLHYGQEEANKMIDTTELLMALRFLKTPYMEKRLKGLNEIKAIVEKVSHKQGFSTGAKDKTSRRHDPYYQSYHYSGSSWSYNNPSSYSYNVTWIDSQFLIKWIRDSQLLDILLHPENTHAEILKRTSSILRFLAQNNALETEVLHKLWACQEGGKHEAVVNAVLQLVTDIASSLSLEHLNMLYQRISTTPLEQCDDAFINFLKDFSKNAIQSAVSELKKQRQENRSKSSQSEKPSQELSEPENPQQAQGGEEDYGAGEAYQHADLPAMSEEDKYNNNMNYGDKDMDNQPDDDPFYQSEYAEETLDILKACIDEETGAVRKEVLKQFDASAEPGQSEVSHLRAYAISKQSFGLPYLWYMMQDEAHVLSQEVALQAEAALQEILGEAHCADLRLVFLLRALANIQDSKSIVTSFGLAKAVLTIETPEGYAPSSSKDFHPLLTQLNSMTGMLPLAVEQIEKYMQFVRGAMQEKQTDPRNVVYLSKYTHQRTLESMLHFIDFCVTRSRHQQKITLGEELLSRLWNIMIKGANHECDAEIFLSWLQTSNEVSLYTSENVLSSKERKFLFNNVLCSEEHLHNPQISLVFFKCFDKFFKDINKEEYNIEIVQPSKSYSSSYYGRQKQEEKLPTITVNKFTNLIGLNSLWGIAFVAQNIEVRKAAIQLLVDLHLRISTKDPYSSHSFHSSYMTKPKPQKPKEIWSNFITHCMGVLEDSLKQLEQSDTSQEQKEALSRAVDTALSCLGKFLDGHLAASVSQGVDIFQNAKNALQNPVQLEIEPDGIHKTIHLPMNCHFREIKLAVQKSINVSSPDEFLVLGKKGRLLASSDDELIKAYHIHTLFIHRVQKKRNLLEELAELEEEDKETEKASQETQKGSQEGQHESSEEEDEYSQYDALTSNKYKPEEPQPANKLEHPKYLISQNPAYIDLLVRLLEVGDGQTFIKSAWDLLMKLPVSRKLALELRDLQPPNNQEEFQLNEILPLNSMLKMLYSLQIVRELAEAELVPKSEEVKESESWGERFMKKGGLQHLLKAIQQAETTGIHTTLQIKYYSNLLALVQHFSEKYFMQCHELISQHKAHLTVKILQLLTSVSEYTIEKEQELLNREVAQTQLGPRTPLKKASTVNISPVRKRRKAMRKNAAMESSLFGMGGGDAEEQAPVKMTSAQKWGMGEDDDSDDEEVERADDPLVMEANEEAQIFQCAMRFLFQAPSSENEPPSKETLALVAQIIDTIYKYEDLEELLSASLLRSVNYKIRQEMADNFQQLFKLGDSESGSLVNDDAIPQAFQLKKRVLNILVEKLLPEVFENPDSCEAYFELLGFVFAEMRRDELQQMFQYHGLGDQSEPDSLQFLKHIASLIINKQSTEFSQNDIDLVLVGLLNLARCMLIKYPEYKESVGKGQGLVNELLLKCLFEIPSKKQQADYKHSTPPPKCKSTESRSSAFGLLLQLVRDCPMNLKNTILNLLPYHRNNSWRSRRKADWEIYPQQSEKSTTGFVGLKNLGCICYLNSVMQQLFMIESFRDDILACPDKQRIEKKIPDEDNVLLQIQLLFGALRMSEKMYFNPQGFCHAFKDWEGQPINVLEQMDADQFFNMLMDRLEGLIKGSPQENTINEHFGGKYANEIICKDCPHFSEREEPFMNVALQVKGKKTVQESLEAYVTGDLLEGDNAFFCDKCDKKVTALKRACIKKLPRTLVLALKRFEYNFDTMQRVKCNDYCDFPMLLDMEPYTQEGLKRIEKQKQKEKRKREQQAAGIDPQEEAEEEDPSLNQKKYPDAYYKYKLSGVVIHIGTAESGHYYSLINDRQPHLRGKSSKDMWYEFNDTRVTSFDPADIPNEAFGGEETWTSTYYSSFSSYSMKSEKMRNGYLLLYERVDPWEPPADEEEERIRKAETKEVKTEDTSEDLTLDRQKSSQVKGGMLQYIFQEMEIENLRYWYNRFLFSREYQAFVENLAISWSEQFSVPQHQWTKNPHKLGILREMAKDPANKDFDFNVYNHNFTTIHAASLKDHLEAKVHHVPNFEEHMQSELLVFRFHCTYFLAVLIRTKHRYSIPVHLDILKSYLNRNYKCAEWLLYQLSHPLLIKELLLECPVDDMREFVAGIIECAMEKLYPMEKDKLSSYWPLSQFLMKHDGEDITEQMLKDANVAHIKPPALSNFMNALLAQYDVATNFSLHTSHYLRVIAKFTLLGDEAIDYLLRAKAVGRLLDFYTQYPLNEMNSSFRKLNDLWFRSVQDRESEFGLPIEVNLATLSSWDQFFARKREKSIAQRFGNLAYLWQALSRLIRSTDNFMKNSKYALRAVQVGEEPLPPNLKPIGVGITEPEKNLFLLLTKSAMKKIFEDGGLGGCIVGMKELGMLFAHIGWENMENSQVILKQLVIGINEKDFDGIQPFLVPYKYMLSIEDSFQKQRTIEYMNAYTKLLRDNKNYAKLTRALITNMIKLARKFPFVQAYIRENSQKLKWLFEWIRVTLQNAQYQFSSSAISSHGKKQLQADKIEMESLMVETEEEEAMLRNLYLEQGYDSDDDMVEKIFYIGQKVDYKQVKGVMGSEGMSSTEGEVMRVLDEMLQVQTIYYGQKRQVWVHVDENKIYPLGVRSSMTPRVTYAEAHKLWMKRHEEEKQKVEKVSKMMGGGEMSGDFNIPGAKPHDSDNDEDDSDNEQ